MRSVQVAGQGGGQGRRGPGVGQLPCGHPLIVCVVPSSCQVVWTAPHGQILSGSYLEIIAGCCQCLPLIKAARIIMMK